MDNVVSSVEPTSSTNDDSGLGSDVNRKRQMALDTEASQVIPKKMRIEGGISTKLIFGPQFYVEVQRINGRTIAKCVGCHKHISGVADLSNNFVRHLRMRHRELHSEYLRFRGNHSKSSQASLDKILLNCIVDLAFPMDALQSPSFQRLHPSHFTIMDKPVIVSKLEERFDSMMSKLRNAMSEVKYFFTTVTIWQKKGKTYLIYTCHWFDIIFQRKSAVLAFKRIRGLPTAKKITEMLEEINKSFSLNDTNILMTIMDKKHEKIEDEDDEQDDKQHKGREETYSNFMSKQEYCASYKLNLLGTTDFLNIMNMHEEFQTQHTMTFAKCKLLWITCQDSEHFETAELILGGKLDAPKENDCRSLYIGVEKLLQYGRNKLNELLNELGLPIFTEMDLQHMKTHQMLMNPIFKALQYFEHKPNFGGILPVLVSVSYMWLLIHENFNLPSDIGSIAVQLEHQLRERFKSYFSLAPEVDNDIVATVLNSEFKIKWLARFQKTAPEWTEDRIRQRVIAIIIKFLKKHALFGEDKIPLESFVSYQLNAYLSGQRQEMCIKYTALEAATLAFNTPLPSLEPMERMIALDDLLYNPSSPSFADFSFEKLFLMKSNVDFV